MRWRGARVRLLGTLIVLAAAASCARHTSTGQPVPAEYRITQSLAILVEANKTATETVIQLNKSALVDDAAAGAILSYTATVAQASKAALVTMNGGLTTAEKCKAIEAAFSKLTASDAVKRYLDAHKSDAAAQAMVAALQSVELLIESVLREVNS